MEIPASPYLPPDGFASLPLERLIPPFPVGVVEEWLAANVPPGSWLIDPLGANPLLSLRAAQAGFRILTSRSNPILHQMLEVLANAPKNDQFKSAINLLMNTSVGDIPLDEHLKSLYLTQCIKCGQMIQAHGYIWERDRDRPIKVIFACQNCGEKGETPLSQIDLDLLSLIDQQKHKFAARARQRVASGSDTDFIGLEEALKCYPTRALHVLMTLINKLDGLSLPSEQKRLLQALLITLMDLGNNLWHWPAKPFRPLTLTTPGVFLERNLWLTIPEIIRFWTIEKQPVIVSRWPELPPESGGICLYQRRETSMESIAQLARPQAMLTMIPRPNQAFLTFSALWSGWLWGPKAIKYVHGALERRRYDWHWLAGMLQIIFKPIQQILPEGSPALGLISEPTPSNLFAINASAKSCLFSLRGLAYRSQDELFQIQWRAAREKPDDDRSTEEDAIRISIENLIKMRGEPVGYEDILYVSLIDSALHSQLPDNLPALREDYLNPHQNQVKKILQNAYLLKSYKHPTLPQTNLWWLAQEKDVRMPLADGVERLVVEFCLHEKEITLHALDQFICGTLTGLNTPGREILHACLESYADPLPDSPSIYHLRKEDEKENRENDQNQVVQILNTIAGLLGYQCKGTNPLRWRSKKGWEYKFFFLPSACLSTILHANHELPPEHCVLVIPGSRSHLIQFKLRRDPHLQEEVDLGWKFMKLRFLRKLAMREILTSYGWEESFKEDPPSWDPPTQMQML